MINIHTLGSVSIEKIHAATVDAFSDYPEPYNKSVQEQQYLMERRGYSPELSFGAFDGNELVSYTLNGIGEWNGLYTAYDSGTGTIKKYRQRGLAAKVFEESIPVLKAHNIAQYLLEVICVNTKAFDLYKKQGFEISRELDYYVAQTDKIAINDARPVQGVRVEKLNKFDLNWPLLRTLWEFEPSWQNSIDAINCKLDYFIFLGIYVADKLCGYGIIEAHTGDIPQFAIEEEYRGRGLGTKLFYELMQYSETGMVRLINADAAYEPFKKFMLNMNIRPGYGQYEMILKL